MTWSFAAEIIIRTLVMFTLIILLLRFTDKRGIRQLTIFELPIILPLGSIAGDPIFYLGQVEVGLLETDGEFSVLLFPHDETQYGLPIFPEEFQAATTIEAGHPYACMHCGDVESISESNKICERCHHAIGWAKALNNKMVN